MTTPTEITPLTQAVMRLAEGLERYLRESDMAVQIYKAPYLFDFLGTDAPRREVELERGGGACDRLACSSNKLLCY